MKRIVSLLLALSILGTSSNLYAQERRVIDNGQLLTVDDDLNFDELDVRQDPDTKEYIFSESGFTQLWAHLLFLEGRVIDLGLEVEDEKKATAEALAVSETAIKQVARLLVKVEYLEDDNIELRMDNIKYKNRPNTFEVVMGGTAILIIGTAIGLVIGVVAE